MIILDMLTQLALWQERLQSRRILQELDSHLLQDIGMTGDLLTVETSKPWWRA